MLALLALVAVGAGCNDDEGRTQVPGQVNTSATTTASVSSTSDGQPIREYIADQGKRFGYITMIEQVGADMRITVDTAEWFEGDAAKAAAKEDRVCVIDATCAPNGFYIRNHSTEPEMFTVNNQTAITLLKDIDDRESRSVSSSQFMTEVNAWSEAQKKLTPFQISVNGGVVTRIDQQFLP